MNPENQPEQLKLTPKEELAVLRERLEAHAKANRDNKDASIRLQLAADLVQMAKHHL